MVAGLLRGLDHEDAAKFSFLLATPVPPPPASLKLPTLAGPAGDRHSTVSSSPERRRPASPRTCRCASSLATSSPGP